ncbi:rhodanese-like domain-containing protein [Fibrobacter sp.]|uniref:rhodanese-like domain-containing protein n=1 Tax=Fibrobacter sp. TaxID=35828 RepID=UPI00388FDA79
MKKLIGLAFCTAFLVAGCNETPKQETATVEKKAPAAVAAVAPATPAQSAEAAPAAEAPKATITDIDWNKALEMSKAGAVLIDVRTPAEVAEGMAPGAINIPLQEIEQRLSEFPKDKDLLIYCRSGKRSMAASNFLIENGYDKVFNVVGGFLAFPK